MYTVLWVMIKVPILKDLPNSMRIKLAYDCHKNIIDSLHILDNLDVLVITEVGWIVSLSMLQFHCLEIRRFVT
jgi:hypothetical protein